MKNLITELSFKKLADSSEIGSFSIQLKEYYEGNDRHRYSEVSKVIFGLDDDKVDTLRFNLEAISLKTVDGSILKNVEKLIDHTDLAQQQKKYIEDKDKELEVLIRGMHKAIIRSKKEMFDNKNEFKVAKDKLEKIEGEVKDGIEDVFKQIDEHRTGIYTQFVTILGIFTAIIIGVFGGMQLLENVMGNIENVKITKLLMFSSLMMGAIFTILYLLLVSIAALTDRHIKNCGCSKYDECTHSVFKKHPIYIIGMMSSLYLFIISVVAHGFGTEDLNGLSFLDNFMGNGISLIIISAMLLIVFIWIIYLLNRIPKKDT